MTLRLQVSAEQQRATVAAADGLGLDQALQQVYGFDRGLMCGAFGLSTGGGVLTGCASDVAGRWADLMRAAWTSCLTSDGVAPPSLPRAAGAAQLRGATPS